MPYQGCRAGEVTRTARADHPSGVRPGRRDRTALPGTHPACGLRQPRWGELAALRRRHIDPAIGTLRVEVSVVELVDGSLVTGPPKSTAGKRTVFLPAFLLPEIITHLERFTSPGDDSLVFAGPKNGPLRRPNFSRAWRRATESAGLTGFHFHDLWHTGNHITAATGASLRELMGRMGHSTTRAALIYQHRTTESDRLIAATMSAIVETELDEIESPSGTYRARG